MGKFRAEESRREHQFSRLFEVRIGPKLRQYYAGIVQQPVPPRLLDLLRELEEKDQGDRTDPA